MTFSLRPYSFMAYGVHTVWEPGPPFDAIPYNLFAAGMRTLRLEPGVTLDELRDFLVLFLIDPSRDLPPEDDIAAAFWERGMPHIKYDTVDAFAEGDAAEREAFYNESDQLEQVAATAARQHMSRVEAKAMAVSTDRNALNAPRAASPLALDDVVRTVFAQQLEMGRDKWSERFVDALVEGYLDAAVNRDAPLVLASLRKSAADLVVAGRIEVAVQLQQAVEARLGQRVGGQDFVKLSSAFTNALFGAEVAELTLKYLAEHAEQVPLLTPIFAVMSPNELQTMLGALRTNPPPPNALREAIFTYVERVLPGHETEVGAAAAGLEAETTGGLLAILGRANTAQARSVLASLTTSDDVNVKIEAKVLASGSPEQAHAELGQLLENHSALVRMASLRCIARYHVRGAWPTIARMVKAPNFNELGFDERRDLLRALILLSPQSGEPIALEIAKKGGVIMSEAREGSRSLAIDVLGELSRSMPVATALQEIAQSRWGTSDETRSAAANASRMISARVVQGGAGA
jgi:serine/threonine-protein kinase